MQGRLMGKRVHAQYFVDENIADHGVEGCNYLLALDMEMDPIPGYSIASWEQGYGDFALLPDLDTLRRIPWLEGTALVLSDVGWGDDSPVRPSPRQVLKAQVERARSLGYEPMIGSELEFYLLKESFEEAHAKHYRDLTPSVPYILDYHVLATTYDEPLLRQIRNGMYGAGITVESSKGEAWPGQQEVNFKFADAVTMADNHTIYKNGAKEIAHLNGCSITFMAKPDHTWIGSSCHIHASLWRDGANAFDGAPDVFKQFRVRRRWRSSSRRRSTRTSGTRRAPGPRRRSPGGMTTAPADSGSSATVQPSGSRREFRAATSILISHSQR
jgi:glutamine synthetase